MEWLCGVGVQIWRRPGPGESLQGTAELIIGVGNAQRGERRAEGKHSALIEKLKVQDFVQNETDNQAYVFLPGIST